MHVFFGRINAEQTPTDQFSKGYYQAPKGSTYFGELNQFDSFDKDPVYIFMIAGNQTELWKADQWDTNGERLLFTKTNVNLQDVNRAWFAALKYFYLDSDL